MDQTHEVSRCIADLGDGDPEAEEFIWRQYFDRIVRLARRRMEAMPRRQADEEDVALSAMYSFYRGMKAGRFEEIEDRDDLWKLLAKITARKACKQRRREYAKKRGGGQVHGESAFMQVDPGEGRQPGIGDVMADEPTPESINMLADNTRAMLDCLRDPELREIAELKLQGYSAAEIAKQRGWVKRRAERKLERIRAKWTREGLA